MNRSEQAKLAHISAYRLSEWMIQVEVDVEPDLESSSRKAHNDRRKVAASSFNTRTNKYATQKSANLDLVLCVQIDLHSRHCTSLIELRLLNLKSLGVFAAHTKIRAFFEKLKELGRLIIYFPPYPLRGQKLVADTLGALPSLQSLHTLVIKIPRCTYPGIDLVSTILVLPNLKHLSLIDFVNLVSSPVQWPQIVAGCSLESLEFLSTVSLPLDVLSVKQLLESGIGRTLQKLTFDAPGCKTLVIEACRGRYQMLRTLRIGPALDVDDMVHILENYSHAGSIQEIIFERREGDVVTLRQVLQALHRPAILKQTGSFIGLRSVQVLVPLHGNWPLHKRLVCNTDQLVLTRPSHLFYAALELFWGMFSQFDGTEGTNNTLGVVCMDVVDLSDSRIVLPRGHD
ncbi:hypothetical protein NLI96_g1191 [Meripilus lineatus]|uniref:F-box domain-containing protein n=1 Tax=Meripilus lineatus TaxID=2056292 RepID=A0AAD5VB24_9APHY|nr:hypothetical protein NLI96_g1191 [Physisporinus lineatus]